MKRLSSIAVILLLSVSVLAGNGPKELEFCNTQIMPGTSKNELYDKAYSWIKDFAERDGFPNQFSSGYNDFQVKYYVVKNGPNFGLPRWIPGGQDGTEISFYIAIKCRDGSYTARLFNISTMNPHFYAFYGENGKLYPEMYNRKQIKNSIPILEYISNLADDIFLEIKEYMTGN